MKELKFAALAILVAASSFLVSTMILRYAGTGYLGLCLWAAVGLVPVLALLLLWQRSRRSS